MKPFGNDGRNGTAMKFRIDGQWRWLVALGGILVPGIVFGAFSVPHTFEAGTPIKASEMNANFEAIAAKLDAQANPPAAPAIGTLTLDGLASALPITKFSQSIDVPIVNGALGKTVFSEIFVQRPADEDSPDVYRAAASGSAIRVGSIVLGDLTVELQNVRVTRANIIDVRSALPQEVIALTFRVVSWVWDDGVNPATSVTYDVSTAVGGGPADDFSFGYFPAGVTADNGYTPISSYQHEVGCIAPATGCKVAFGPLLVKKWVGADSLNGANAILSGTPVGVALDWFADDATINNSVVLEDGIATSWSVSTDESGVLLESVGFTYGRVIWQAGIKEVRWDVAQNAPF